jgi:hypothetical protein
LAPLQRVDNARAYVYNTHMFKKRRLTLYRESGSMTLPNERYNAIFRTEQFLKDLCDPKRTPRVPRDIRIQASRLLRHYPSQWDMDRAAHSCPQVFESQNQLDDLQVWIISGKENSK